MLCSVVDDESGLFSGGVWYAGYFPEMWWIILQQNTFIKLKSTGLNQVDLLSKIRRQDLFYMAFFQEDIPHVYALNLLVNTKIKTEKQWFLVQKKKEKKKTLTLFLPWLLTSTYQELCMSLEKLQTTNCSPSPFIIWAAVGNTRLSFNAKTFCRIGINQNKLDIYDETGLWTSKQIKLSSSFEHLVFAILWIRPWLSKKAMFLLIFVYPYTFTTGFSNVKKKLFCKTN